MFYLDNHNSNFGSLESSYLNTTNIHISTQLPTYYKFTHIYSLYPRRSDTSLVAYFKKWKCQINNNLVRKFTMRVNFLLWVLTI